MGSTTSATPDPANAPLPGGASVPESAPAASQHDFEAQKRIHQQIRNDPDYDDWEYGTEPLPHEAWIAARARAATPPAPGSSPQPVAEG
jgi:hypothetical protein